MATSFKRSHARSAALSAPDPVVGHCRPTPSLQTLTLTASLDQSLVGSLLLSPGSWCTQGFVCALQESVSPVLCKFWQLYGGVNGDLLQADLCQTHTQSPCPCGRPLPTHTSTGDAQTQFCLSLCGVSGSQCAQDLFEPSEHLWPVWGLILNMVLPLLPSCWGFSFTFGHKYLFLVGYNILLSAVVQQRVVILGFLQEKMSASPTPPYTLRKPKLKKTHVSHCSLQHIYNSQNMRATQMSINR